MIDIDDDIIAGTCELYPETLKKFICMEELGELTQAISKRMRDKISGENDTATVASHHGNEVEEIADVLLCLKMIQYYDSISDKEIQKWIDYKQRRQMARDYVAFCDHCGGPIGLREKLKYSPGDFLDDGEYVLRCKEAFDEDELHEE